MLTVILVTTIYLIIGYIRLQREINNPSIMTGIVASGQYMKYILIWPLPFLGNKYLSYQLDKIENNKNYQKTLINKTLSEKQRVAICLSMMALVSQNGQRNIHPEEVKYIEIVMKNILGIGNKEINKFSKRQINFQDELVNLSHENKLSTADILYALSTIMNDPAVKSMTTTALHSMNMSYDLTAKRYKEDTKKLNS